MKRVLWNTTMGVPTQNSSADSFTLTEREFKLLYNVRVGSRSLKNRQSYTFAATTGLSGHVRGAKALTINGVELFFVALESAGVTNVYVSTGRTFTAITASSGPYGDTTLLTPATATPSATNIGTNIITFAVDPYWTDGHMVGYESTASGLTKSFTYYAHKLTATTYSIHTNLEDALNGSNKVNLTANVTGKFFPYLSNTVSFESVRETATGDPGGGAMYGTSGRDLVVISDGAKVLVYDHLETGLKGKIARHVTTWHPGAGKVRQESGWVDYLVCTQANVTPTDNGGGATRIVATNNSAHPDTAGTTLKLAIGTATSTAGSDLGKFAFTTGDTVVSGKQFHVLYDCAEDRYVWDKFKLEVSNDDATYYTVWDGSSSTAELPLFTQCDRGFTLASFNLDSAIVPASLTVKYVKLTYVASSSPSVSTNWYFLGFMGGGSIQGGTLFRPTFYNSGSRAESVGITCDDKLGRSTSFMGCQDSRNYIVVPASPALYYSVFIYFQTPPTADRDKGLDYLLLYARAPGSKSFLYTGSQILAQYTASWGYNTVQGRSQTAEGNAYYVASSITYYARPAPDGLNMPIPPCKCMASVGGRLFCGDSLSQNGSSSDISSDVYFSWQDHPFRFRDVLAFNDVGVPDPSSGGRVVVPGEKVRQVHALNGEFIGTGAMMVWTEKSLYRLEGPDAFQLSRPQKALPFGTLSPWSVTMYMGMAVWLDHTGQIRVFGGGKYETPSRDRVDDITKTIPRNRLGNVEFYVYQDTLRMSHTHSATATNTRILIYDFVHDSFFVDAPDGGSSTHQFGIHFETGGKIYNIDENANLVICEDTATVDSFSDASTAGLQPILLLRETHSGGESKQQYRRIGVCCDVATSKNLDAYWTGKSGKVGYRTGTTYPTIDIDKTGVAYNWNQAPSGFDDVSAYPAVRAQSSGLIPGFQFFAILGEVAEIPGDKLG